MLTMQDFAAIDVETANRQPSSICALGVVVVRDGVVTDKVYRLVRPEPNYYSYLNVRVHGLTCNDTNEAAPFDEVWQEVAPLVADLPLVAHNKGFDKGCLKAAMARYDMAWPRCQFYCTLHAARRVFGKSLPDHRLPTVAAACGYELTHHHNALSDAEACAAIALKIL